MIKRNMTGGIMVWPERNYLKNHKIMGATVAQRKSVEKIN
jgi:hypothetical protein